MLSRRSFLGSLAAGGILALTFPARTGRAATRKVAIPWTRYEKLAPVGGWVALKVKDQVMILVHDAADSIRAFDPTCTHQHCIVNYDAARRQFACPCHGSRYDLDGAVQNGPAPRPLKRFPSELQGDRLVLTIDDPGTPA